MPGPLLDEIRFPVWDRKREVNYQEKPVHRRCDNCHYAGVLARFGAKKKYACTLGDFAVLPEACCDMHSRGKPRAIPQQQPDLQEQRT